jgi:hypothetical protein
MDPEKLSADQLIRKVRMLEEQVERISALEIKLAESIEEAKFRNQELTEFRKAARVVLTQSGFIDTARSIFNLCRNLINAASGYVALLSESGAENEVLFLEAGGLPCDVDPELPMPIRGLRSIAYHKRKAVYDNDFMHGEWVKFMPPGHVLLKNVLFAPLIIDGKAVGVMGLANKETDFNQNDVRIASGFSELAAIALQNSRIQDEKTRAEEEKERVIGELKIALSRVKTLGGMLPICSSCKKVREDDGYWKQIETYIRDHSDADFTHSYCPDCAKKLLKDPNISD